ncbi:MAG: hypothetical protein WD740_01955 [Anaerolineales bacterium]
MVNAKIINPNGWLWANTVAFAFSFALLAAVSQVIDILGAHGATALGLSSHVAATLASGAVVGFLQQRVLDISPAERKRWVLLTSLVYAACFIGGELLGGLFSGLAIAFILFGLLSGFWQSALFKAHSDKTHWWIAFSALGFATAGGVASLLLLAWGEAGLNAVPVILSQALIGALCGAISGALTGPGFKFI